MTTHCNSCGAPVEAKAMKERSFCSYCKNEDGSVADRSEIKKGLAGWLKAWSPDELDEQTALKRAEAYMQAMPYWAEG